MCYIRVFKRNNAQHSARKIPDSLMPTALQSQCDTQKVWHAARLSRDEDQSPSCHKLFLKNDAKKNATRNQYQGIVCIDESQKRVWKRDSKRHKR